MEDFLMREAVAALYATFMLVVASIWIVIYQLLKYVTIRIMKRFNVSKHQVKEFFGDYVLGPLIAWILIFIIFSFTITTKEKEQYYDPHTGSVSSLSSPFQNNYENLRPYAVSALSNIVVSTNKAREPVPQRPVFFMAPIFLLGFGAISIALFRFGFRLTDKGKSGFVCVPLILLGAFTAAIALRVPLLILTERF